MKSEIFGDHPGDWETVAVQIVHGEAALSRNIYIYIYMFQAVDPPPPSPPNPPPPRGGWWGGGVVGWLGGWGVVRSWFRLGGLV